MGVRCAADKALCAVAVCGACESSCLRHHDQASATPTRTAPGIARRATQELLGSSLDPRRNLAGEPDFLRLVIANRLGFYWTIVGLDLMKGPENRSLHAGADSINAEATASPDRNCWLGLKRA